jgi:hypothetical protein
MLLLFLQRLIEVSNGDRLVTHASKVIPSEPSLFPPQIF